MKIIEREFNAITGETIDTERDETAAETKARLDLENANAKAKAEAEEEATAKAAAKASAQAKLATLGLTADEVSALLG